MASSIGVIIPIQSTEAGKQQVKEAVENLGQKVSALVQQYNDLRGQIEGDPQSDETKAKFRALADQRRVALEQLKASYMSARQQAGTQGIATTEAPMQLSGLGDFALNGVTTAVTTEQSKLSILAAYYESYKTAVAAGTTPPSVPAELSNGIAGMSGTTIGLLIAAAAALYFMFFNKSGS